MHNSFLFPLIYSDGWVVFVVFFLLNRQILYIAVYVLLLSLVFPDSAITVKVLLYLYISTSVRHEYNTFRS